MMLASLIAGSLLAAAPNAPTLEVPALLADPSGLRAPARPFLPFLESTTSTPPAPPRAGLLLLGGAAALAGLALTLPAVTHRGCAISGQCADATQALAAGGLFLVGAALVAAADGPSPAGRGAGQVPRLTGAQLRERFGLDIPLGAPGARRTTLRWAPFRIQRGGGVRVGLAF